MCCRRAAPIIVGMIELLAISLPDLPDIPDWVGSALKIAKFVALGVIALLVALGELERRGKNS
jgi:hypothetical protein